MDEAEIISCNSVQKQVGKRGRGSHWGHQILSTSCPPKPPPPQRRTPGPYHSCGLCFRVLHDLGDRLSDVLQELYGHALPGVHERDAEVNATGEEETKSSEPRENKSAP